MLTEEKAALRRELLRARTEMPPEARAALAKTVCEHLSRELSALSPDLVLLYAAVRGELDISMLADTLLERGITVAYPRSERGGVMHFHSVSSRRELIPGLYGIPEPQEDAPSAHPTERSVCIVPAIAYDKNGYRLGYGGGYYDRFLRGFLGKTIGIAPASALMEKLPRAEHDLAVDAIVTERGVLLPVGIP